MSERVLDEARGVLAFGHPADDAADALPLGADPEWKRVVAELWRLVSLAPHSSRVAIDAAAALREILEEEMERCSERF